MKNTPYSTKINIIYIHKKIKSVMIDTGQASLCLSDRPSKLKDTSRINDSNNSSNNT